MTTTPVRDSALALLAIILLPQLSHAQVAPVTLFGIQLESPLTQLPDCQGNLDRSMSFKAYEDKLCLIRLGLLTNPARGHFDVNLPWNKPDYLLQVSVESFKGDIVRVHATTHGIRYQDDVLAALVSRLGKPKRRRNDPLENAFGHRVHRVFAQWEFPSATLTFSGVAGKVSQGSIELESKAHARREALETEIKKEGELRP